MWKQRPANKLTAREAEVLELLRFGLTNEEIAQRLDISVAGVKYHVSAILSKLGVTSREEAALIVFEDQRRWWSAWPVWTRIATVGGVAAAVAVAAFTSAAIDLGGQEEFIGEPVTALERHDPCDWSKYGRPDDVSLDAFERCGVDFLFPNTLQEWCAWEVIQDQTVVRSWPSEDGRCKDPWGVLPEGQVASISLNRTYSCGVVSYDENGESRSMEPIHPADCDEFIPGEELFPPADP